MKTRAQNKAVIISNQDNVNLITRKRRSGRVSMETPVQDLTNFETSNNSFSNTATSTTSLGKDDVLDIGTSYLVGSDNEDNTGAGELLNESQKDQDKQKEKEESIIEENNNRDPLNTPLGDSSNNSGTDDIDDNSQNVTKDSDSQDILITQQQNISKTLDKDKETYHGKDTEMIENLDEVNSILDKSDSDKTFEDDRVFESEGESNLSKDSNSNQTSELNSSSNTADSEIKREVIKQVASILSYNSLVNIIQTEVERYLSSNDFRKMIKTIIKDELKHQTQSNPTNNVNKNNNVNNSQTSKSNTIRTRSNKRKLEEEELEEEKFSEESESDYESDRNNKNSKKNNSKPAKRGKPPKSASIATSNNRNKSINRKIIRKSDKELFLKDYVSIEDYNQIAEKVTIGQNYSFLRYDKDTTRKHISKFNKNKQLDPDYEMAVYVRHHDEKDEYHLNWFDAYLVSIDEVNRKCKIWFEEEPDGGTFDVDFNRVMIDEYDSVYDLFTFSGFETQIKKEQQKSSYVYLAEYRIRRGFKQHKFLQDVLIVKLFNVENILVYVLKERKLISLPMESIFVRKTL